MSRNARILGDYREAIDNGATDLYADGLQEELGLEATADLLRAARGIDRERLADVKALARAARQELRALLRPHGVPPTALRGLSVDPTGLLMAQVPSYDALRFAPPMLEHSPVLGISVVMDDLVRFQAEVDAKEDLLTNACLDGHLRGLRFLAPDEYEDAMTVVGECLDRDSRVRLCEFMGNALLAIVGLWPFRQWSRVPRPLQFPVRVLGVRSVTGTGNGSNPYVRSVLEEHLPKSFPHLEEVRLTQGTGLESLEGIEPFWSTGTLRIARIRRALYERLRPHLGERLIAGEIIG
jgi:hypothetical protein